MKKTKVFLIQILLFIVMNQLASTNSNQDLVLNQKRTTSAISEMEYRWETPQIFGIENDKSKRIIF